MNKLKDIFKELLKVPTAEALAVKELDEAKRDLLRMQSAQDYSKRMVDYHSDRIKRLTAYIANCAPTLTETL